MKTATARIVLPQSGLVIATALAIGACWDTLQSTRPTHLSSPGCIAQLRRVIFYLDSRG
ncbi:MAG: hypothetical protein K1563_05190 [Candidatus Thiodiazotropha sp. (ex. Lucinisca nassula)]|nr:hypothetical protein [Candidatus Thiodiazotropha sp. (ex. Lucinisca nassula)]MBW9273063.1 hypothetical protein [Candidatus Thiodiazotropha sp. (ex. Lucinisca nassula)]